MSARASLSGTIVVALAACTTSGQGEIVHGSAADHGRAIFSDPSASPSASNGFSCATCHTAGEGGGDRVFVGGALDGVVQRTSLWGGMRRDLLESINDCRALFMDAPAPWTPSDEEARAMYAFLASTSGSADPRPFTLTRAAPDVPAGDPSAGATVFQRACATCHGSAHDGVGRLVEFAPRLPDEVLASHAALSPLDRRLVFLHKAREGELAGATGSMPPFSRETLSDADLGALLAFLGQYE